ncbi:hypothetical protein ACFPC0_27505 [Streptomyces andamanensis]|uniref:Uncharacterized protein n=1 Tax=Streptomyces andamanensis TaxID=1565035 RepID=A0ABV8TLK8_9ACTN
MARALDTEAPLDHYAHFMPGAGQRGLLAMDARLEKRRQPKVSEKSLPAEWIKRIALNPRVKWKVVQGAPMSVKYKETARGGLAVNIIEC